jgi:hypothetical protein
MVEGLSLLFAVAENSFRASKLVARDRFAHCLVPDHNFAEDSGKQLEKACLKISYSSGVGRVSLFPQVQVTIAYSHVMSKLIYTC